MKSTSDLPISERAKSALERAGIDSISSLRAKSQEDLLAVKGLGAKSVQEIVQVLSGELAPKAKKKPASRGRFRLPTLSDLISASVHFGHQHRRWHPKVSEFLFSTQQGVDVFDLAKTRELLEKACQFLGDTAKEGGSVLFVGTRKQSQEVVAQAAERSGSFFVTDRWIGGLLTNFDKVKENWHKLSDLREKRHQGNFDRLTKKEGLLVDREIERLDRLFGGLVGLSKLPEVVVLFSGKRGQTALHEAQTSGISVVALVDSNVDPTGIDYPIPGNDDSHRSVELIAQTLAGAIVAGGGGRKPEHSSEEVQQ